MDDALVKIMSSWNILSANMHTLSEEQVFDLMNYELLTKRRRVVVERLHMRYSGLKAKREREELLRTL